MCLHATYLYTWPRRWREIIWGDTNRKQSSACPSNRHCMNISQDSPAIHIRFTEVESDWWTRRPFRSAVPAHQPELVELHSTEGVRGRKGWARPRPWELGRRRKLEVGRQQPTTGRRNSPVDPPGPVAWFLCESAIEEPEYLSCSSCNTPLGEHVLWHSLCLVPGSIRNGTGAQPSRSRSEEVDSCGRVAIGWKESTCKLKSA